MGAGARSYSVQRPKLALTVAAALCAIAVVGFVGFVGFGAEQLWQLHASDAALRSAIETGITLSALVSAVLLLAHFRQTRLLRDLLMLAALATVALTDFVFNALPAYHYQTGISGAGARMALTMLIAGIFLYRALSGNQILRNEERPLYAFLGLYILMADGRFAYQLISSHEHREAYGDAKWGGHPMDFDLIANNHLHWRLESVATLFLVVCSLTPVAAILAHRFRGRMRL